MTLLEEHDWKLPTSLKAMEELAPQVEAAGVTLSCVLLQYPGFGFQFLCNIADTSFLSTLDGLAWQQRFLAGEAKVSDMPGMIDANSECSTRTARLTMMTRLSEP